MTPIEGKNTIANLLTGMQVGLFLDTLDADISEDDTLATHAWTDSGLPLQPFNPPPAVDGVRAGTVEFVVPTNMNLAGWYVTDGTNLLFQGWLPKVVYAKADDTVTVNLSPTAS